MTANATAPAGAFKHAEDRPATDDRDGAVATRAVTIGRPREEVYAFWRDFTNLAKVMENVRSIEPREDGLTHWVVAAPGGKTVEWDARVTADEPGRRIAWRSEPGADVTNHGVVEFRDAPGGRGTEVHAAIAYEPPAGAVGKLVATLTQHEPGQQAHRDLRRLKMLLETGEIATTKAPDAAPRYDKKTATDAERQAETR